MTGTLLQLQSTGIQDSFLTENPEINIFKHVYYRHVNFAIETISYPLQSMPQFGQKTSFQIPFRGHLLSNAFLRLQLPALQKQSGSYASWTNSLGYAILDYFELEINGVVIDKKYDVYLDIVDELYKQNDKGRNLMILKSDLYRATYQNALQSVDLYIPLDFFFTKQSNMALPLIGLFNHQLRINFKLKDFDKCILYDGLIPPNNVNIQQAEIILDYIYLDQSIVKSISEMEHTFLIEQVQFHEVENLNASTVDYITNLNFNHCCKELFFTFVEHESVNNNDYFNYSNRLTGDALVDRISMYLNGTSRFNDLPESYYRLVFPYKTHTKISNKHIYTIPFGLSPEKHQPTGTINFSRFDNVSLSFKMKPNHNGSYLYIFATNYNILRVHNGLFKLEFAV